MNTIKSTNIKSAIINNTGQYSPNRQNTTINSMSKRMPLINPFISLFFC